MTVSKAGLAAMVLVAAGCAPASVPQEKLSPDIVADCRAALEKMEADKVIRLREPGGKVLIDEKMWALFDAEARAGVARAVSCTEWQTALPPAGESVAVVGYPGGELLQLTTENWTR